MKKMLTGLLAVLGVILGTLFVEVGLPHNTPAAANVLPAKAAQDVIKAPSLKLGTLAAPVLAAVFKTSPRAAFVSTLVRQTLSPNTPAQNAAPSLEQRVLADVVERVAEAGITESPSLLDHAVQAIESAQSEPAAVAGTRAHLMTGVNIQGGVAATFGHATGYVVALQWLKYGTTNDPRNLKYAFLSPAFYGAPNVKQLVMLPMSVNVAHLVPHQPFTNVWVSPLVGVDFTTRTFNRAGIALTATF